ncbi:MAG TPA: DUF1641 domain-containing protein [Pseudacidobacterium sp.]|jgi:uncharacterized protein YjgD (DUF1641 family)|nr:DUF1641 domain-containing protein [Pseudacidobacterium sp.]
MAKPISLVPQQHDPREGARQQLENAPLDHAEAILSAYKTLQALHDSGALDILRGAAGAKDFFIGEVSAGLNTPEGIRGIRNLLALSKLFASIDPDELNAVVSQSTEALEKSRSESENPPSLWQIFKKMSSKESRRALNAATNVLESVGKNLRQKS